MLFLNRLRIKNRYVWGKRLIIASQCDIERPSVQDLPASLGQASSCCRLMRDEAVAASYLSVPWAAAEASALHTGCLLTGEPPANLKLLF